jgi:hypothetical protein
MMHLRVGLKQDYNMYVKQQGRLGDIVSYFAVGSNERVQSNAVARSK